nr:hypothetical protein [Tanacetum cinerariifolium]
MSYAFADTHNLVAILTKSDASKGFNQIINFLNCSYINQLTSLPNEEIFTGLACMGFEKPSTKLTFYKAFFSSKWKFLIHTILHSLSAKRTSWNEFSSAMASSIICLSTGKGFSRVETPLFEGMLVVQKNVVEGIADKQVQDDVAVTTAPKDVASDDLRDALSVLYLISAHLRSSINANTTNIQKGNGASQKATCYECGNQGHYRRDCPEQKNQNHENRIKSTKARGVVHAFGGGETKQDLYNIEDEIEA